MVGQGSIVGFSTSSMMLPRDGGGGQGHSIGFVGGCATRTDNKVGSRGFIFLVKGDLRNKNLENLPLES